MTKPKKVFTTEQARGEELRQTVISCITQKLRRMDIDQLSHILAEAERIIDKAKKRK